MKLDTFVLFGSSILFAIATAVGIIILLVMADKEDEEWSTTTMLGTVLVYLGLTSYFGDFKVMNYLTISYVVMYLCIGTVYALLRVYFKGVRYRTSKKHRSSIEARNELKEDIKHSFCGWIIFFPFTLIVFIFTDLTKGLNKVVKSMFSKLIDSLFDLGMKLPANKEVNDDLKKLN